MTTKKNPHAQAMGRKGGAVKSFAKADNARANGRLGGRPRKTPRADVDVAPAVNEGAAGGALAGGWKTGGEALDQMAINAIVGRVGVPAALELIARRCDAAAAYHGQSGQPAADDLTRAAGIRRAAARLAKLDATSN